MKRNFSLLVLSIFLLSSCTIRVQTIEDNFNSLKSPVVLIAKSKTNMGYYSIVVKTANDSLVSYNGIDSEMVESIGESFNINDTIK